MARITASPMLFLASATAMLLLLCSFSSNISTIDAREIQATKEWTLLGENDTVAAGMHIRMDLQTGEKWVKLPDDNDDGDENNKNSQKETPVVNQKAEIDAQGGVLVIQPESDTDSDEKIATTTKKKAVSEDDEDMSNYDFEMMHRTLSKLPDEEKEQMQLPHLPTDGTTANLTPEERTVFEERMTAIWKKRQEQLRQFEQDFVADLPEILKDRIQRLQTYLKDPVTHLREMNNNNLDEDSSSESMNDDEDAIVTHIVSVLKDLEYQLSDVDMTRDFFTLGGWPLLVSLVSDTVHTNTITRPTTTKVSEQTNSSSSSSSTIPAVDDAVWSDDLWDTVYSVQAHAAWVVGTAVKNTGEFKPYALKEVELAASDSNNPQQGTAATTTTTTALDLFLQQYVATSTEPEESSSSSLLTTSLAARNNKSHKLLYGLSSLLRGNRPAQVHFCAANGPSLLADKLASALPLGPANAVSPPSSSNSKSSQRKTIQRLLSLADDIVLDVELHAGTSKEVDAAIVQGFSSPTWCANVLKTLEFPAVSVQEQALKTIQTLGTHCNDEWNNDPSTGGSAAIAAVQRVEATWKANADDRDPELHQELLSLVASTKESLERKSE